MTHCPRPVPQPSRSVSAGRGVGGASYRPAPVGLNRWAGRSAPSTPSRRCGRTSASLLMIASAGRGRASGLTHSPQRCPERHAGPLIPRTPRTVLGLIGRAAHEGIGKGPGHRLPGGGARPWSKSRTSFSSCHGSPRAGSSAVTHLASDRAIPIHTSNHLTQLLETHVCGYAEASIDIVSIYCGDADNCEWPFKNVPTAMECSMGERASYIPRATRWEKASIGLL